MYFHILNHAKKYVHIMTPYLILDGEMTTALTRAAKSNIEVIIIMPHIPDKKYAFALAKTYYEELLEAGVQIYEYTSGFVHAKVFVADDDTATVGTINLDYRSLYLHFECGTFIYQNAVVYDIEEDFQNTLKKCQKISITDVEDKTIYFQSSRRDSSVGGSSYVIELYRYEKLLLYWESTRIKAYKILFCGKLLLSIKKDESIISP